MQRTQQMRQPHLEVGQERKVGSGPGDLLEVQDRRDDRLLKDRRLHQEVAARTGQNRSAGKRLAALESHELDRATYTPCSPAMSWASRLQRARLTGRPAVSSW